MVLCNACMDEQFQHYMQLAMMIARVEEHQSVIPVVFTGSRVFLTNKYIYPAELTELSAQLLSHCCKGL